MSDNTAPHSAPESAPAPEAPPVSGGPSSSGATAEKPQRPDIFEALADLLQLVVDWLRQEAGALVQDKVVQPIQRLGLTLASAGAAGCLIAVGMTFIAVALLLLLATWLGWPGALFAIGGVLLLGAGVFTYLKMRSIQR
jgi:hypothetical protein